MDHHGPQLFGEVGQQAAVDPVEEGEMPSRERMDLPSDRHPALVPAGHVIRVWT